MAKSKEPTGTAPVTAPAAKEPKKSTKATATATASTTAKTKSAESAAAAKPAKKPAAKASEKPVEKTATVPAEKSAAPAVPDPAPAQMAKKSTAKAGKPVDESKPVVTVIVVKIDVGHGNNLYIRGDGHSLNWESGVLMENVGGDTWQWTTNEVREGILAFKLLINDEIWSTGENMNAPFGETSTFNPTF